MPLKIAISGSSGQIGQAVMAFFKSQGHFVTRIVRQTPSTNSHDALVFWDMAKKEIDCSGLEGHDVVIHLAGASIAGHRWTKTYKELIYSSRVESTQFLCEALSRLRYPPRILFSASAIGYYGSRDANDLLDESAKPGDDFLAGVCVDWEKASQQAAANNIRVIHMRFGPVLGPREGVLAKMLVPFKLGLGGIIGTGRQMFSWIVLDEIPRIISHLIDSAVISGPINFVSPDPVSNFEFTKVLGKALKRPTVFPLPAAIVRILFGEMGDSLLLGGARIFPGRLLESGYQFRYPDLKEALITSLGRLKNYQENVC